MKSNQSYCRRSASDEQTGALRSITPQAREDSKMAADFSERSVAADPLMPMPSVSRLALSA